MRTLVLFLTASTVFGCDRSERGVEASADSSRSTAEHETELIRADSLWFAAYLTGDTTGFAPHLAVDFRGNSSGRELDRADIIDGIVASGASGVWQSFDRDWTDVRVLDDVGLVRVQRTARGTEDGEAVERRFVYLDVYRLRGDRWECVSGQSSPLPDP